MARVPQNPTELKRLRRQLAAFRRVLPSLDLKRKQVAARLAAERAALSAERAAVAAAATAAAERLPMLAGDTVRLSGLARVESVEIGTEMVAGVGIPRFERLDFDVQAYSRIGTPHWVDGVFAVLHDVAEVRARQEVRRRRVERLEQALRKATQRVNLLEKLLVPRTERAARRIELFLADAKRAEVIRAKLAKARRPTAALERPA